MEWDFEVVAGPLPGFPGHRNTEGPAWDGRYVLFTHIPTSRIMRFDPQTGECTVFRENTGHANGLAFDLEGRLYGCCSGGRSIVRFEPDGTTTTIVDKLDGVRLNTPNDLAIDLQGRIWFSNPWSEHERALYCGPSAKQLLDHDSILRADPQPDGTWVCKRMTFDTTGTNGLLISPDQKKLYMIDRKRSPPEVQELRAYDILDDGTLGKYIVLHLFGTNYRGRHRGVDGMCLDSEGNIVAPVGNSDSGPGPMVIIWDPKGRVLETHPMPAGFDDGGTNCTFGDPDLRTLYITNHKGHLIRVRNIGRRGWLMWPPVR